MPLVAPPLIDQRPSRKLAVNVAGAGWIAPSRKVASRSSFWVASSWGDWFRDLAGDQCRRAGEEVAVGRHAGRALEGVAEEERERPAMLAVADVFLGLLVVAAGREQDMPPLRRCVPAPPFASTLRLAAAASASATETRNDSIGRRRRSVGARRTTVSISRVPEPEWQQSRITATCGPFAATSPISLAISLSARSQLPGFRLSKQTSVSSRWSGSIFQNSSGACSCEPWPL